MYKLPDDFYFGGATAAYQCEGATTEDGKGDVIWDTYLKKQGRFNPDPACDFYHRYPEDLKLCHEFGINAIRVSISWARIFPEGFGRVEQRGVDYYHKLFAKCREDGVEPFVTLHHFDTPQCMQDIGGWLSDEMLGHFVEFAKFCFEEFGSEVKYWITINEPTSMSSQQYIGGTFPPGIKYDFHKCFQAEYNMNLVHARIVKMFKDGGYDGEIGIVHALQTVYPITDAEEDKHAALLQDALDNSFYLDGTLLGKYSPEVLSLVKEIIEKNDQEMIEIKPEDESLLEEAAKEMDFVGMNYYFSKFMRGYEGKSETFHNGTGEKGSSVSRLQGVGEEVHRKDIPSTDGTGRFIRRACLISSVASRIITSGTRKSISLKTAWDARINSLKTSKRWKMTNASITCKSTWKKLPKRSNPVSTLKATSFGRCRTCSHGRMVILSVMDSFMLTLKLKKDIRKRAHIGIKSQRNKRSLGSASKTAA